MLKLGKEAAIEFAKKNGQVLVRGWKPGEKGYLLAEKPRGQLPPLSQGQGAIVRMEKNGVVYGMAVVYREVLRKTNLCFFSFQDDVVARKLRDEDRIPCLLPVTVHRVGSGEVTLGSGIIVDLCKGGLRMVTRAPMNIEPGDELTASFYPGGMGYVDRQMVRLMRVNGYGGRFEYAARFVDIGKDHGKLLDDYLTFCKTWSA